MGKRGKKALRKEVFSEVLGGAPTLMRENQLPLSKDVGLHVLALEMGGMGRSEAISATAEKVQSIYTSHSIPTIPIRSIQRKVKRIFQLKRAQEIGRTVDKRTGKGRFLGKHSKRSGIVQKGTKTGKLKLSEVVDQIFEVVSEVPELEKEFYEDQCKERRMVKGGVDAQESLKRKTTVVKNIRKQQRALDQEKLMEVRKRKAAEKDEELFSKLSWDQAQVDSGEEDAGEIEAVHSVQAKEVRAYKGYEVVEVKSDEKRRRMSQDGKDFFTELVQTCARFGVTETATSTIYNLVTEKCKEDHKLNQSQIAKWKKKLRLEKVEHFQPEVQPEAIGFDERKDNTKSEVGVGHKGRKRFELTKEEHCSIILYPGDEYAGHVVPRTGRGETLAEDLAQFLRERNISMTNVKSLVSDGCEKMLGWKSGVHATMEKIFKMPFGRIVCFLHHLEKSFEVIFLLYSGHSTSPGSYAWGVGKEVKGEVHKLPVKAFEVLPNPSLLLLIDSTPESVFKQLSNDHKIFIR